jgi:hypothetical protein
MSNPPPSPKFDAQMLAANVLATYATEAGLSGNANVSGRKLQQMVRTAIANASWQGGFMVPTVRKWLSSLGVREVVAVQAGYQSLALWAMDMLMARDRVGFGTSAIEGTLSAYGGDALATKL